MSLSWAELASGVYVNPELSDQVRVQAAKKTRLFELVTPAEDFALGKQSGDKVAFKLAARISGTAETALSEFQKIPMYNITQYEAQVQVFRRGIAVPWTKLREDLDRVTVNDLVVQSLREHSARTHNKIISDALVAGASYAYVATGAATKNIATNGTPAASATVPFTAYHARQIKLYLTQQNVPFADGETYHAVCSPTMIMNLFDDVGVNGFVDVKKYSPGGADGALNGEVGSYMGIRFMEDNDSNAVADLIGTGSEFGSGFICGYDACREVIVYPMELIYSDNLGGDFGQQRGVAWVSLLGYKTVWVYASHGQGVVLRYTST